LNLLNHASHLPASFPAPSDIPAVHVIQSAHLDVGFAKRAPDIVNLWFTVQYVSALIAGCI
jgi:hypothetical protein